MKLLLSTYTGFPQKNSGGPNKIINEILNSNQTSKYDLGYLSKHAKFILSSKNHKNNKSISSRPKYFNSLFNNNILYRDIVTHPLYLKYHFYKTDKYFYNNKEFIKKFDIIHSHDVLSLNAIKDLKRKKILTIHSKGKIIDDMSDYLRWKKDIEKIRVLDQKESDAINSADLITFPSHSAKELFTRDKKVPDEKNIRIIYNGIDIDFISRVDEKTSEYYQPNYFNKFDIILLNIADHIKVKNIDILINVVDILKNNEKLKPLLINLGTGPETENLMSIIKKRKLEKNTYFLGKLTNFDAISLMKVSDFLIMASDRVIFDLVILEAMASGTVVIASNNGGNKEVIKNSLNGFLVDSSDPYKYVDVILSANRTKIIQEAYKTISNFDVQNMVSNYMKLYEQV